MFQSLPLHAERMALLTARFVGALHPDDKPEMTFDYHLREGVATSTNALKLMEIVGLPIED
jgi:DNA mismatch repair ATPase MutS